jgi:hypothetical protein
MQTFIWIRARLPQCFASRLHGLLLDDPRAKLTALCRSVIVVNARTWTREVINVAVLLKATVATNTCLFKRDGIPGEPQRTQCQWESGAQGGGTLGNRNGNQRSSGSRLRMRSCLLFKDPSLVETLHITLDLKLPCVHFECRAFGVRSEAAA